MTGQLSATTETGEDGVGNLPGPDYTLDGRSFDESISAGSGLRPHWRDFFARVGELGLNDLKTRWEEAKHLIRENGVTYNVYGDPRGMSRPWELDPIPLLVDPAAALSVEAGLIQRARLLDRLLADLYGPQTVLTRGVLPPEFVFGHPGFLRPCHGMLVPGDRYLHLYAADLGRAPDGSYFVLRDRTQAPSGAGYALENRIVLSRMLPETFRECRVQRLSFFFRTLRDSLRSIAPWDRDNPRVVLLTPGPYNETYFEHAFLARYLGYTLVEGGDLTVRDNKVYLKLLGGLQPVDVILRRVDDDYCDPLDLRGDSFLGVAGLVQAVRAGNVAVANALGSGLVESPALPAYLPALCRSLLGEELLMPSVPTWWCGDPVSCEHVLANLATMVIKSTFPPSRSAPVFGEELTAGQLRELAATVRAEPAAYVGQERLKLSTAPSLVGDSLRPRHLVVRAFLTSNGSTFSVMPGGLTRVASADGSLVVSMQKGGGSKDTWLLSPGPVNDFSLLPATVRPVELTRGGGDLPSRAADDLYWLGRYVERTECVVRLLRGILVRLTEQSGLVEAPELPALLRALTYQTKTEPGFLGAGSAARIASPFNELFSVIFDDRRPGTLASTLAGLRRVAGHVRDRISTDMWRVLGGLDLPPWPTDEKVPRADLSEMLDLMDRKIVTLAAFGGLIAEGMTRGQGWRFLDMGRRLERSLKTLGLLRSTLTVIASPDGPLLEALLEIADSAMTYRRRYMSRLQTAPVLDLLLADEDNPRSLAFQFHSLSASIDELPRPSGDAVPDSEQRLILSFMARLRGIGIDSLAESTAEGTRPWLDSFLSSMEVDLPLLSDALTRKYLTHLQASRQFASEIS